MADPATLRQTLRIQDLDAAMQQTITARPLTTLSWPRAARAGYGRGLWWERALRDKLGITVAIKSGPHATLLNYPGLPRSAPIEVRTSNSSGKNVNSSARLRKDTPLDPPVPGLKPMMRCTVRMWRKRQS